MLLSTQGERSDLLHYQYNYFLNKGQAHNEAIFRLCQQQMVYLIDDQQLIVMVKLPSPPHTHTLRSHTTLHTSLTSV